MWNTWKQWARSLRTKTHALYLATGDPRVPRTAKILAVLVVAYALSPIDLIPDFIPLIGHLDDLVVLPLGIALAIHLIPREVWEDNLHRAAEQCASPLPANRKAAIAILTLWATLLLFVLHLL